MSILIKDMEMPKNCDECRIMTYEDTNCISVHELYCGCPIVFRAHPQHEEHRPDYCPLVEVKPHGRLIDVDAKVQTQLYDDEHEKWTAVEMTVEEYLGYCNNEVPTIIEAEEDE